MGIAGLILLILMLIGGCVCAMYIIRAMRPHTNEIDVPQSSIQLRECSGHPQRG
jgi:hypothetical protein